LLFQITVVPVVNLLSKGGFCRSYNSRSLSI